MGVLFVFGAILLLLICSLVVALLFRLIFWPSEFQRPAKTETQNRLVQDPVCGRYVAREDAITDSSDGSTVFFCSRPCLLQYTERHKRQRPDPTVLSQTEDE